MHRLSDAGLECFHRLPIQLTLDFPGIDGVAAVMARAVLNVRNQVAVLLDGMLRGGRGQLLQDVTKRLHHLQIPLLVVAADVVGLSDLALGDDRVQRPRVVFDI
ncbi:hypothetical protein D3C86_1958110 [compost metagenome]